MLSNECLKVGWKFYHNIFVIKVKQLKDQNSELSRKKQQLEADKAQVEIDKAEYRENFKTKVQEN